MGIGKTVEYVPSTSRRPDGFLERKRLPCWNWKNGRVRTFDEPSPGRGFEPQGLPLRSTSHPLSLSVITVSPDWYIRGVTTPFARSSRRAGRPPLRWSSGSSPCSPARPACQRQVVSTRLNRFNGASPGSCPARGDWEPAGTRSESPPRDRNCSATFCRSCWPAWGWARYNRQRQGRSTPTSRGGLTSRERLLSPRGKP